MTFDIEDFINRVPHGITKQELGQMIYEEIRVAENTKVGFLDQATDNPEFYVDITRQLDFYINQLKTIYNRLAPTPIALDEEVFASEQPDIDKINELIKRIEDAERNRWSGI
ncbi:hypothetical protein H8S95_11510 [Pontibacter sp. KCTC 32443]|uniref:hypothetical protein n=1 Tax=Pontibacter TaxID=323449 RepID=UPI00164E4031|nr:MULTISPECIES: hypothetical protein [Pontibacter]MBC5774691.1 hypothetical protein [Pontibacter sp. KCTC 32443]